MPNANHQHPLLLPVAHRLNPRPKTSAEPPHPYQSRKIDLNPLNLPLCWGTCCSPRLISANNVQCLIPGQRKLKLGTVAGAWCVGSGNVILSMDFKKSELEVMYVQYNQWAPEAACGSWSQEGKSWVFFAKVAQDYTHKACIQVWGEPRRDAKRIDEIRT